MLSITKLISEHVKYTQDFNYQAYRSVVLRKKNSVKVKSILNSLKKNSDEIGNFFVQEIVGDVGRLSEKDIRSWKKAWNMVFFGTNEKPGHTLLVAKYIGVLYKKGDNRMELNNIFKELTKTNLDMIMKFWSIIDQRIFNSKDENVLNEIREGWTAHLVCTKKYIDTLKSSGFGNNYDKVKDDCTDQGAKFAESIDSYLDGYSDLVENSQ